MLRKNASRKFLPTDLVITSFENLAKHLVHTSFENLAKHLVHTSFENLAKHLVHASFEESYTKVYLYVLNANSCFSSTSCSKINSRVYKLASNAGKYACAPENSPSICVR